MTADNLTPAQRAGVRPCSVCRLNPVLDPDSDGVRCALCYVKDQEAAEEAHRILEARGLVRPGPTVKASEVVPQTVNWLWTGRVPLGMPTVLGGFPGVGKSTILYDLAARTSRHGKAVLVVTAEDHLAAVARPRLEAAEADLELIQFVVAPITLPDNVDLLASLVREDEAALLVLDPLVAFIGDSINTHRDHHVRRVLAPLAGLAEDTGAAVVVVIHTNKGTDSEPLMRISGSIGFTGAARSVLLAADDPQDESRRILAVVKSNLAEVPPPLAYSLAGVELAGGITTSRVNWMGEAPEVDVRELLASRNPEERTQLAEAVEFLRGLGLDQQAMPARDVIRDAESGYGIGPKTVQRARHVLNLSAWKDGFPGVWMWGPKWTPDLDTGTPVQLSSSARPAETGPRTPDLDNENGAGYPSRGAHDWLPWLAGQLAAVDGNYFLLARRLQEMGCTRNGKPWTAITLERESRRDK